MPIFCVCLASFLWFHSFDRQKQLIRYHVCFQFKICIFSNCRKRTIILKLNKPYYLLKKVHLFNNSILYSKHIKILKQINQMSYNSCYYEFNRTMINNFTFMLNRTKNIHNFHSYKVILEAITNDDVSRQSHTTLSLTYGCVSLFCSSFLFITSDEMLI